MPWTDLGGLEMEPLEEPSATIHAAVREPKFPSPKPSSSEGMLDCGATASAAPDIAVHSLIQAVLSQDAGARIDVQYVRPFFRFGKGKWGQALFRATIHPHVSGQHRQFSPFALPNPDDMDEKNIVPILIGMDHLGTLGC